MTDFEFLLWIGPDQSGLLSLTQPDGDSATSAFPPSQAYGGRVALPSSLPPRPPKMTFERLHGYNPMFTRFFEFCDRLQL